MDLTLGAKIAEGGFSDVYEATDALDRELAVKIIRGSVALLCSAQEHARALARVQHPNVVSVIALEKVIDPQSGELVDGIVMERLSGESLAARLRSTQFTIVEVTELTQGLIAGLKHIHAQGITHGDLHAENVMVVGSVAKIIDILYRDSLALLSAASKDILVRKDLLSLRQMIYDALLTSEMNPALPAEFHRKLGAAPNLQQIEEALEAILVPAPAQDQEMFIQHALARIRDDGYVEGVRYATALAKETPAGITKSLLLCLIDLGGIRHKHKLYISMLWDRLDLGAKGEVAARLAVVLDREVPNGDWGSPILILSAFRRDGWEKLPELTRIRLEAAILNDILAGQYDYYNADKRTGGILGTYSNGFCTFFKDQDRLLDNIVAKLKTSWNSQNYIGKYLLDVLATISYTPKREARALEALEQALRNDAKTITENMNQLPQRWTLLLNERLKKAGQF